MFDISAYQTLTQICILPHNGNLTEELRKTLSGLFAESAANGEQCEARVNRSCLIMTGRSSARVSGALDAALLALQSLDVRYELFERIEPNPLIETVNDCIEQGRRMRPDFVFAIGAGSVFDASKAVALGINGAEMFKASPEVKQLPIVGLLTASGTGSETTPYCRVTDSRLQTKHGIANKAYITRCVVSAECQKTIPPRQARSMFLDVLCHCCESAVCVKMTEISKQASFEGLRYLRLAGDAEFMSDEYFQHMARASVLGGCAINLAPCVLPHEMSYRLTIKYDIPHGATVAMVECSYLRFVARERPDEVEAIYRAFADDKQSFEAKVHDMAKEFAVSVAAEDFAWIAKYMCENGKTGLHSGRVTEGDIVDMFKACELLK